MASKFLKENFKSLNKKDDEEEEKTAFQTASEKFNKNKTSSIKGSISDKELALLKLLLK
jgi:hypothetical protein|tara:strand:- start:301 stop:477 length:177 start_codon:yes stop_codon:yes gene_type:complete